jgi:N-acetylglucosamine malate deacetylase 2
VESRVLVSEPPRVEFERVRSLLAVCAHPDDESFGMGAVISAFVDAGTRVAVLSFTHGEASTLHGVAGDLARIRAIEFSAAGRLLRVTGTALLDYPDGGLSAQPMDPLAAHVRAGVAAADADTLLVFDVGGITGHPDHVRATQAALAAAESLDLAVLAWAIPAAVANRLNEEFGTAFVGRAEEEIDHVVQVDRGRQRAAIAQHASQSRSNPVLWRRLELLGDTEAVRWLRHVRSHSTASVRAVPMASSETGAAR